jgi:hypothetical protein
VEKTDIISTTGLRKTVHAVRIPAMHKGYTYPHYLMLMGSYPQGHPKISNTKNIQVTAGISQRPPDRFQSTSHTPDTDSH